MVWTINRKSYTFENKKTTAHWFIQNSILIELPSSWNTQMIQMPSPSSILPSPMPTTHKMLDRWIFGLNWWQFHNALMRHRSRMGEKSNSPTVMRNERRLKYYWLSFHQTKSYLRNKCINVLNHSHLIMRNIHRRYSERWVSSFRN